MKKNAIITAYNENKTQGACDDFSMNVYWGSDYKNVLYIDGSLGRSRFENIIETVVKKTGQTERVQNSTIERHVMTVFVSSPLLGLYHSIDKCDIKQITFPDTGETFNITNIDLEDQGDEYSPVQLVFITFEDDPISKIQCSTYVDNEQALAYWDNDDDGVKDLDGSAEYDSIFDDFYTWQLYYEADGVTPLASGDVQLLAYAVSQQGQKNLVGIFEGKFGDSFSDATKWQSTQSIWDYFGILDTVAHRTGVGTVGRVRFDKRAFAEDNGYFSDEQEDRAVEIVFELGVNGSERQPTTMDLVYTVWGAFNSMGVQDATTRDYGVTIVGKTDQRNTLNTIQDIRAPLPSGTNIAISSSELTNVTAYSNEYTLDTAPASPNETFYKGVFSTNGGYKGESERGSYGADNFTISVDSSSAIDQFLNILNFTTGNTPYEFDFDWKMDNQTGGGGFPELGDVDNGTAQVLIDGALVNALPSVVSGTLQVTGTQTIVLPDTEVHTIKIELGTVGAYTLYTEFEAQLKPLF